jgi:hypothetical protein
VSDLALLAAEPTSLEQYADPGAFVIAACIRAKQWLEQAVELGDFDRIVEMKSQAEAIRVYTAQKQIGRDAELAASEIVRRAERGLGLAIRAGQEAGTVLAKGVHGLNNSAISPKGLFSGGADMSDAYAMTDGVSDEQFEDALAASKEEGNLSRANVVREVAKAKAGETLPGRIAVARQMAQAGSTTAQIAEALDMGRQGAKKFCDRHGIRVHADDVVAGTRRTDSNRIVAGTAMSLLGIGSGLDRIDYSALDGDEFDGWLSVLKEARKSITTLINSLEKERTSRGSE